MQEEIKLGDSVEVIRNYWNDIETKHLVGMPGKVKEIHCSILIVVVNNRSHMLHIKELKKVG